MEISSILVVILLCLGAVQGIVYGMSMLRNTGRNQTANHLLAAILFFLSYHLILEILVLFGVGHYDVWYHFMVEYNWIYGPLIFFFVKAQVMPDFKLQRKDWVHFIPVMIEFVCSNFVRTQNSYWDGTRESLSWLGYWGYVVWMNYPTVYLIAGALLIFYSYKAERLLNTPREGIELIPEQVRWIRRIILAFRLYFAAIVAIQLVDLLFFGITFSTFYYYFERFYYYPFFVGMAVLTYWLGMEGFSRKDQPSLLLKPRLSSKEQAQFTEIADSLRKLMQEKQAYKDPTLTLVSLAEQLHVKPYLRSKCLKVCFDTKFNDYLNELRIEALTQMLRDSTHENYTLLGLAFEAGFNSKASFNRAVKKQFGISPKELKAQIHADVSK